jgi:putative glutamine amidotransferase
VFATLLGRETIRVNSLHGQGILDPGERIVVDGRGGGLARIEAIRIAEAPGFALGSAVACRARSTDNAVNRALFQAFRPGAQGAQAHGLRRALQTKRAAEARPFQLA